MARVYLGIGSNMGNRKRNILKAIDFLKQKSIEVKKLSRIVETTPVEGPPQRKFLNAAIEIETRLTPLSLLKRLKEIEKRLGRQKTVSNGPRPVDLDILLYGNKKIKVRSLVVPHPKMWQRDFVIKPLKEIAPEIVSRFKK